MCTSRGPYLVSETQIASSGLYHWLLETSSSWKRSKACQSDRDQSAQRQTQMAPKAIALVAESVCVVVHVRRIALPSEWELSDTSTIRSMTIKSHNTPFTLQIFRDDVLLVSRESPYYTLALQLRKVCGRGIGCVRMTFSRNRGNPIYSGGIARYG